MQWDPDYHGSVMFVPVVYVTWWMFVMMFSLTGNLIARMKLLAKNCGSLQLARQAHVNGSGKTEVTT